MKPFLAFLSGKKSYIVSIGAIGYALGIAKNWWTHNADVDLLFGGTYGLTLRAAVAKLCRQVAGDMDAPKISGPPRVSIPVSLIAIVCSVTLLALPGCTNDQLAQSGQKASAFANSPARQTVI